MADLTVVMPVYNEEEIIKKVLISWLIVLKRMKIDFVIKAYNDGSKDDSLHELKKMQEENKELVIIDKANSGHGRTILLGYKEADSKWIFQVDSDGEMEAEYFHSFWDNKDGYDLVIGERHGRKGPWSRRLISLCLRFIVRCLYGKGIKDINCPYRLYKGEKFHDVFTLIPAGTFAPNVLLSGYAVRKKLKISTIPVPYKFRKTGKVSIKKIKLLKAMCKSFVQTVKFRFAVR